jgi:hypothetical protein
MNIPSVPPAPELIERDELVTSGETEYCIMARAPFTRSWRLAPVTVNSLLAGEADSSSPTASAAALAFRVHAPRAIEVDRFNRFMFSISPLRLSYLQIQSHFPSSSLRGDP